MIDILKTFLTDEQISSINDAPNKGRSHPVKRLMFSSSENGATYFNTEKSLLAIIDQNQKWLERKVNALADLNDYSASSSVLGEVRAYGYLLNAEFKVTPIPETEEPTPDFHIENDEGEKIEVEVNSKQFTSEESKSLEEFNSEPPNGQPGSISSRYHVITPFGKPKPGESITENVISKFASIKQKETQFSSEIPSILWLDFQDEIWHLSPNIESIFPIRSWQATFQSGEIWYGFYGKKGLPIFEGDSLENMDKRASIVMRHEGRYRLDSKIDACIMSFKKDTVILENPYANHHLPEWFFEKLPRLRGFNVSSSWFRWPENKLLDRIEIELLRIEQLNKRRES